MTNSTWATIISLAFIVALPCAGFLTGYVIGKRNRPLPMMPPPPPVQQKREGECPCGHLGIFHDSKNDERVAGCRVYIPGRFRLSDTIPCPCRISREEVSEW